MIRILVLCLLMGSAYADTLRGRIVGVSDGDTVTLLDAAHQQHKIRLAGIDAPEKSQAFGQRAKEHLSDRVFGQLVTVEVSKTDRYGRLVGKIMVSGMDANLGQIRAGMAWHYKQYEKEQTPADRRLYAQTERAAQFQRLGLWRDANPQPPWDFRHGGAIQATPAAEAISTCPCGGSTRCTGPKGGQYCLTPSGNKRYQ